ncbi:helix-turn-helix domain-containing protein [Gluconobacter morbifer]|nr:helix-turn-helix domain-containing protein [Gluconobacter morbifer]
MARKPKGMHPEEIVAHFRMKYGSLSAYAKKIGKTVHAVSNAIRQQGYFLPIQRLIAKDMNMLPHDVWPEWFLYDGTPVSVRANRISIEESSADLRRNGVAA